MALKRIYGLDVGIDSTKLLDLSRLVADASRCSVPPWKAIVGENTFAHESGIHAHSVLQNPETYEPFSPEEVGWERRVVVGKHSGRHAVTQVLEKHGIKLNPEETKSVLDAVRQESVKKKRSLTTKEVLDLVQNGRYSHAIR